MNIKNELAHIGIPIGREIRLNDLEIDESAVRAVMINEVVPADPKDDFYGGAQADYLKTTIPLFQKAGIPVTSIAQILSMGIYITNAVKTPKTEYQVEKASLEESLPYLEQELALFPNVKVIMLMGDVAKKAYNMIAKSKTKKTVVPSISTYKIRNTEIYHGDIRIMPSYIMTGGNILIEKSKVEMASQDIATMVQLIK